MRVNILHFSSSFRAERGLGIKFPGCDIPSGMLLLIEGENGSGKTTLLNWIHDNPSLLNVDSNIKLELFKLDQFYEHMVYPYKKIWWNICVPKIVKENMSVKEAISLSREMLKKFELNLDVNKYPSCLSGGEMHMVIFLRILLSEHNILLIDEPTTGVDKRREGIIWNMMNQLVCDGKTIILVSHNWTEYLKINETIEFSGMHERNLTLRLCNIKNSKELS